ncbi:DUF2807 domain-containing protein [Cupriavidus sp. 2TAF22]|uniref:GIN domain-containing protein n=1 Tax=unclassified Cupriavidus TaxID=2640874 RepID=UPI003F91E9F6
MACTTLLRVCALATCCLCGSATAQQGTVIVNQSTTVSTPGSGSSSSSVVIVNGQVVSSQEALRPSGPEKTELRHPGAFSGVQLNAPVTAVFSVSPAANPGFSVAITGPADVLPLVLTTVADGRLSIDLKAPVVLAAPLKVAIGAPSLQAVSIPGAASLRASGLREATIDLELSGSGSIVAEGQAGEVRAALSGSGNVDAGALRASRLDAWLSGSGRILGIASDEASIALAGSGQIVVRGRPMQRHVSRTGSGQVSFE